MRYIIQTKVIEKYHPYLPSGVTMYYLYDTFKNKYSLGCYTNLETARYWQGRKNNVS